MSGATPVVDVRQTGIPQSFNVTRLQEIPSARDPWVMIEQTPGIVMDRENVGGNESGQQSNWYSRGTDFSQNTWNYDGVNITDMAATGASPMYIYKRFHRMLWTEWPYSGSSGTAGLAGNIETAGSLLLTRREAARRESS